MIVAAGTDAGIGVEALPPVQEAMDNPLKTKTITLSCGKLTTGVSVKPWTGIFMLRNSSSPETYFQAAFRVQTPWTVKNPDSKSPNKEEIIKQLWNYAPEPEKLTKSLLSFRSEKESTEKMIIHQRPEITLFPNKTASQRKGQEAKKKLPQDIFFRFK